MTWTFSSDRPVYVQIMDHIRGAVLRGLYAPGSKIPSVRDLATEAKVNPNTMQHALSELEREGLLTSHGTMGRFITEDPLILQEIRNKCIRDLAEESAARFALFGISPSEVSAILAEL